MICFIWLTIETTKETIKDEQNGFIYYQEVKPSHKLQGQIISQNKLQHLKSEKF